MKNLGGFTFQTSFPQHGWGDSMSDNMLKASVLLNLTVMSRTTSLPPSANEGDTYIDPSNDAISIYFNSEWNTITPRTGAFAYVIDDDEFVHYNGTSWVTALDLSALPGTTPEQMAFYAPGRIRPNRTTFMYVPAIEKTIVGGMVGSTASLEVAPSGGNLVFSINANGSTGTITFADGSATGTISFDPSDAVLPVGSAFLVTAPSNTYEAEGLTLSIACKDRGLTNG